MEYNTKYEFEKDIYADFLDQYRDYDEEVINYEIIKEEYELKNYLDKRQIELFEEICSNKNKLHKSECLRLIAFVIKNYKKNK